MILPSPNLFSDFGLSAVTASEIEFYLFGSQGLDLQSFWDEVRLACVSNAISIYRLEKERGHEQFEISLMPCHDPLKTGCDTNQLKNIVSDIARKYSIRADFSAKPLPDDFGSGLHINIHLENADGKNVYFKSDALISQELECSIGGLLRWLLDSMTIFAPNEASYKRFVEGSNAPLTVSWGANNRTAALRLPDSEKNNKRIEHRVAGADADAEQVIMTILAATHYGLKNKIKPPEQIYGDARLPMYNCQCFPKTFDEAQLIAKQSHLPFTEYNLKGILINN